MFRVKICGITTIDDARHAASAGADAIGLNFYTRSPRYVDVERAREIADVVGTDVARVGVFVNATVEQIYDIVDRVGLNWIQLHGDEPPEYLGQFAERRMIRALRIGRSEAGRENPLEQAVEYLRDCKVGGRLPDAVLVDAQAEDQYGGTGETIDWDALTGQREWLFDRPLVLAGGLTADNVSAAIRRIRPQAVDTASGVESAPGRKDPLLVERFVRAARSALTIIDV